MSVKLEPHASGVILPVRAQPGARRSEIRGVHDGALRVAVTQVAEKGKANAALLALLAKELQLRKSQLKLIAGETASQKRFLVSEMTLAELEVRLRAILP